MRDLLIHIIRKIIPKADISFVSDYIDNMKSERTIGAIPSPDFEDTDFLFILDRMYEIFKKGNVDCYENLCLRFAHISGIDSKSEIRSVGIGHSDDLKFEVVNGNEHSFVRVCTGVSEKRLECIKELSSRNGEGKLTDVIRIKNLDVLVFEWIDGRSVRDVMNGTTNREHFYWGYRSGIKLKKLHEIPLFAKPDVSNFVKSLNDLLDRCRYFSEAIPGYDRIVSRIHQYLPKITEADFAICHGDYNVDNILVSNQELMVIDFEYSRIGSVYEDVDTLMLFDGYDPYFSAGMIYGYCGGFGDQSFWRNLSFYHNVYLLNYYCRTFVYNYGNMALLHRVDEYNYKYCEDGQGVPGWFVKILDEMALL
ncbi:phosphotransferase family protein [Methanomassiliicoccus luminyensis]|jgi:tRNA A-37 threonylcarbamoyl transferase component Bud32|uniref:phosphotransferase family protein n=1 Tax=Methanomassiliicoccus luminyensis TaxID=1080712 RepID=UPI000380F768|nr:aminoglycoside phosphotransferase family protein [Methanomassiliicoccus luminyensis]